MFKRLFLTASLLGFGTATQAAVVAFTWQDGDDIRTEFSGTLDLTGLMSAHSVESPSLNFTQGTDWYFAMPNFRYTAFRGPDNEPISVRHSSQSIPLTQHDESWGDTFGYRGDFSYPFIALDPRSWDLDGSVLTLAGGTLIRDLTVDFTDWGTTTLSWSGDTITHNWGVAAPMAPVPLPAGLPLVLSGIGALMLLRRRTRRASRV